MVCVQVHKLLLPLPPAPYRFRTTVLLTLLMIMCSVLSGSQAKPCKCSGSDQDPRDRYTWSITFDRYYEYLFPTGSFNTSVSFNNSGPGSYSNRSSMLNTSDDGYFLIPRLIQLWEKSDDGANLHEASFNVSFTMSIYIPENPTKVEGILNFDIQPIMIPPRVSPNSVSFGQSSPTSRNIDDNSRVSVQISLVDTMINRVSTVVNSSSVRIGISIKPPENYNVTKNNYTVWIDYDRDRQDLSVYVNTGKQKPDNPIVNERHAISDVMTSYATFGLFSSMGQLSKLHTWNETVEQLPDINVVSKGKWSTIIVVSVVLGSSVVVAAIVATAVCCYFNSKYRRWKKDLEQLAKSMQRLPGVPIQVSFADIQKATNNFHETMKLGRGGFGAVYRCSLPAPVKGEVLEVAVKKFTRDDNRRYEDFLAEVSVINRLRHKNIVPLIGWSYNKGEPLLIYEYMPNGSLDQHLFRRCGDQQQQISPISQWETRYNIVKDVATGLQYVHHEYNPMVLHRDIKANNIMIDSTFHGCLGDFGLACVVAEGKNSYTDIGAPGTLGFRAHEYIQTGKATRKTDIFAFGVLILEIVTGKTAVAREIERGHITDWVWHLHKEGRLLDAVDTVLTTSQLDADEAIRLLLLGLACSNPNPSDRPSMMHVVQVITKLAPPPDVPLEKPTFVWPPAEWSSLSSRYSSAMSSLERSPTTTVQMAARGRASSENGGNSLHHRPIGGPPQERLSVMIER